MTAIVFAAPPTPPPPPPRLDLGWERLDMWIVDRFGQRWDVSNWMSGVFFMQGIKGLDHPKIQHQEMDFANVDGASWNGLIVNKREVWWPMFVFNDTSSADYLDHTRRWWRALNPRHTVDWYVRAPSGEVRHITVRMADAGGPGSDFDDVYYGWAKHGITGTAHDPWWTGERITRKFNNATPVPFFGPDGNNGPPFRPSRDASVTSATIDNPGDGPTPLMWKLVGPIEPDAVLGFGDSRIDVPIELLADEELIIDTREDMMVTLLDGVDVTGQMVGRYDMDPIPEGEEIPLEIAYAGTGTVEVYVEPRYWRGYA